jgi:hypothetical protein
LTFFRMAPLRGWDEVFYVGQLTSLFSDVDLMLQNDLLAFDNPLAMRFRALTTIVDSGALQNTFSIGPAILHGSYLWPLLGLSERPIGPALQYGLTLGSMVMLIVTVLATRLLLRRLGFTPAVADLATVLSILGGPLALYGTRNYLGSHLPSALLTAGVILAGAAWLETGARRYALYTGLGAGLLVVNRWQDVVVLLALMPAWVACSRDPARRDLRGLAAASVLFATIISIQCRAWYVQFGSPFVVPQGPEYLRWTHPQILPFLVSGYHGLVPWTPAFAAGLLCLAWAWHRPGPGVRRQLMIGFALVVPAAIYVSACPADWWGGDSYGARRLASITPLAAVGLAHLLARLSGRARAVLAVLVIGWMAFTTSAYFSNLDDLSVVFTGATDRFNPLPADAYESATWSDPPWPIPRVLRPGFTFSQKPGWRDAPLGMIAVLLVMGVTALAWRGLVRSRGIQRAALAAALAWLVFALVAVWRVPDNTSWNRGWQEVVRGRPLHAPTIPFPRGVDDAASFVLAVRAYAAGRVEEGDHFLARVKEREYYRLYRASALGVAGAARAAR